MSEAWLDKRGLAQHYSCGVRSIETALAEGMPHAIIFGRVKFQVSQTDPWLEDHGYFERRADDGCTVVTGSNQTGAAPRERPAPRPPKEAFDGNTQG